jgi:hypothetical protein
MTPTTLGPGPAVAGIDVGAGCRQDGLRIRHGATPWCRTDRTGGSGARPPSPRTA